MVAALPFLLAARCSSLQGVGVRGSGASSGIEIHLARCAADSVVKQARLTLLGDDGLANTQDDPVLWEITSETGQPLDVVTVGVTPPGFREVVPLAAVPEGVELHVGASPNLGGERFRRGELRSDAVLWSAEYLSSEQFQGEARSRGQCDIGLQGFWHDVASFAVVGALFLAVPGGIVAGLGGRVPREAASRPVSALTSPRRCWCNRLGIAVGARCARVGRGLGQLPASPSADGTAGRGGSRAARRSSATTRGLLRPRQDSNLRPAA